MKNSKLTFLLAFLLPLAMAACKSNKMPVAEQEVIVPCSGKDYRTDSKVFRANSVGESVNQATSKSKAMTAARNDLAQAIMTTVNTVTENFVVSREITDREELGIKFQSINREIVNQTLKGTRTVCETQTKTGKNTYKSYVALELSANELVDRYRETISKDERLRLDYDYEKFKKTFEEEMNKRQNQ